MAELCLVLVKSQSVQKCWIEPRFSFSFVKVQVESKKSQSLNKHHMPPLALVYYNRCDNILYIYNNIYNIYI